MIVDVHTHTPRHREPPPPATGGWSAGEDRVPMRPDRPDPGTVTWADYMAAMAPVDRAIVFNIAPPPEGDVPPHGGPAASVPLAATRPTARTVNDATGALVKAHPEKLIGFMSVHPRDPQLFEEM